MKLKYIKILFLFSLILFFTGCERKNNNQTNVGILLPLTGNGALYGEYVLEGIELVTKNSNLENINIIIEDSKTTAKDGIFSINKLIKKDNIDILIGPMSSSVALSVGPIADKNNILMITTGSAPKISDLGKNIFRIYPSDSYDGKFLAKKIIENKLYNNILLYLNNDFGAGISKVFAKEYKGLNGKTVDKFAFEANQIDFSQIVTKISKLDFDNLLIVATQKEYVNILNKLTTFNIENKKIFAPVNIEDSVVKNNISANMLDNIYYSKPNFDLSKNDLTPLQTKFKKEFTDRYNKTPNIFNAYGYDLINLVIKIANDSKNENFTQTLKSYKNLNGATGSYSFDNNGDVEREFNLLKLKNLQ